MAPTRWARIGRASLALAASVSVVLLTGAGPSTAAASVDAGPSRQSPASAGTVRVPVITQPLPAAYDPVASYEGQAICSPTPKPGAVKLANLVRRTYGTYPMAISRGCGVGGTSEHKEGRALDWMVGMGKAGHADAEAFLGWLLGPDQAGVPYGNAIRLGVMYIAWNDRFWRAYDADRGWTQLDSCPSKGDDTSCHRNHVHISLSWDGASGRSSIWDGTALTPFCPSSGSNSSVLAAGRAPEAVPVPSTRVLDTRLGVGLVASTGYWFGGDVGDERHGGDWGEDSEGTGWGDADIPDPDWPDAGGSDSDGDEPWTDSPPADPDSTPAPEVQPAAPAVPAPAVPCRVGAARWGGDGEVRTKVTGQGGVPEVGVAAVAVTVRALGSTAPASVRVQGSGQPGGTVVTSVRMNGRSHGTAIVPVAADGTIALTTSAGATDVTLDVTGYYLAGDQPNRTDVG